MKLLVGNGLMYAGNVMFCRVEAGNGRAGIPIGVSEVEVRTATEHGTVPMPHADEHGWIGGLSGADIVVGRVMGKHGLVPCLSTQKRLVALCESAADNGERVTLEVTP